MRQARRAPGYIAGSMLRDRDRAFWTLTLWESEADMRSYRNSGAHQAAMPRLYAWADEAVVTRWEQEGRTLPSWSEAQARMRQDPRWTKLARPSPRHQARIFPDLRGEGSPPLGPKPATKR